MGMQKSRQTRRIGRQRSIRAANSSRGRAARGFDAAASRRAPVPRNDRRLPIESSLRRTVDARDCPTRAAMRRARRRSTSHEHRGHASRRTACARRSRALGAALALVAAPGTDRLQRGLEQPASARLGKDEHDVRAVPRALAEVPRSDELVLQRRDAVHVPGVRAAVRLPLPEAAVRAHRPHRRGGRPPPLPRQGRQRAARRRAGRPGRRDGVRHPDQAGHQVRAASGVRQGRERRLRLSRA